MTKVCLLTLREPSIFTSKMEMGFMCEGMGLWISFTSHRRLNTEFSSCAGDELNELPPILVMVKIVSSGCLPSFSLRKLRSLILSHPGEDIRTLL